MFRKNKVKKEVSTKQLMKQSRKVKNASYLVGVTTFDIINSTERMIQTTK